MPKLNLTPDLACEIRLAGLFYLAIIMKGLGAELGLRAPLIDLGDAGATGEAILAAPGRFRLAIAADLVMVHQRCRSGHSALPDLSRHGAGPGAFGHGLPADPDRVDRCQSHGAHDRVAGFGPRPMRPRSPFFC